jgi:hypothetical protein
VPPNCGEEFIKPSKPALMSLCLPCLGDFYLGHRAVAVLEAFGYSIALFIFLSAILSGEAEAIVTLLFFLAIVHGMDALLTHHVASKGLVSVRNAWGKK